MRRAMKSVARMSLAGHDHAGNGYLKVGAMGLQCVKLCDVVTGYAGLCCDATWSTMQCCGDMLRYHMQYAMLPQPCTAMYATL
eukprot:8887710-Pyramimonas_sp.AAC.1